MIRGKLFGARDQMRVAHGGRTVAMVSRKWFRIRDTYAVDVNTHREDTAGDPALALSVAVAVDALTDDG